MSTFYLHDIEISNREDKPLEQVNRWSETLPLEIHRQHWRKQGKEKERWFGINPCSFSELIYFSCLNNSNRLAHCFQINGSKHIEITSQTKHTTTSYQWVILTCKTPIIIGTHQQQSDLWHSGDIFKYIHADTDLVLALTFQQTGNN